VLRRPKFSKMEVVAPKEEEKSVIILLVTVILVKLLKLMVTTVTIIQIVLVVTFVQYKGTLERNTNSVSAVKRSNLCAPAYTHVEGEKGVCR
jgi:hypothetical protein